MAFRSIGASGFDYTTIAAAWAASSDGDILELHDAVHTENVSVVNTSVIIQGYTGNRSEEWNGTGATDTLRITSTLAKQLTIRDIVFNHSVGGGDTAVRTGISAGSKVKFMNCTIQNGAGNACINFTAAALDADALFLEKCRVVGNISNNYGVRDLSTLASAVTIENCIMHAFTGSGVAIRSTSSTSNVVFNILNVTMDNNNSAINISTRANIKNVLFSSNTTDFTGTTSDITYSATNKASGLGSGTGVLYNLVLSDTYVNQAADDFHEKIGSVTINAGTTVASYTWDYENTVRPQGSTYDIGAYEYVESTPSGPSNNSCMLTGAGI